MIRLKWIWERQTRNLSLLVSAGTILVIAGADWRTPCYVSLGFLYLFPIMLAAGFLPRWATVFVGVGCAVLMEAFGLADRSIVRFAFEALALSGCGLFVVELCRSRCLTLRMQERLRALVETSPAAIVTVNEHGIIELANRAAEELMLPSEGHLSGRPIATFVPQLQLVVRPENPAQFRTSMQSLVRRGNGETCAAEVLELYRKRSGEIRPECARTFPAGAFLIQRLEGSGLELDCYGF